MKIMALREAFRNRIAELTDQYENKIVDLRIEVTELYQQIQQGLNQVPDESKFKAIEHDEVDGVSQEENQPECAD